MKNVLPADKIEYITEDEILQSMQSKENVVSETAESSMDEESDDRLLEAIRDYLSE